VWEPINLDWTVVSRRTVCGRGERARRGDCAGRSWNNSLPNGRASLELNNAARSADVALATKHRIWVIRADIVGRNGKLTCFGSSEIVDPEGNVIQEARLERHAPRNLTTELLVAEIDLDRWHRELCTRVSRGRGHLS